MYICIYIYTQEALVCPPHVMLAYNNTYIYIYTYLSIYIYIYIYIYICPAHVMLALNIC